MNEDWLVATIWLAAFVLVGIMAFALFTIEGPPSCTEYGTVMVTVDNETRCVPWEDAPDIQDFPTP